MLSDFPARPAPVRWLPASLLVLALSGLLVALLLTRLRPAAERFEYLGAGTVRVSAPPGRAGEVLLVVSGPGGETQRFTLSGLERLPAVRYRARHPQLKREFEYTGVPLRDLAAGAGLGGRDLRLLASDNFAASVQADDYLNFPVMLAYLADGRPITVAEKGPLLLTFPNLDEPRRFPDFSYAPKWVWYAERLEAAPRVPGP